MWEVFVQRSFVYPVITKCYRWEWLARLHCQIVKGRDYAKNGEGW